MRGRVGDGPGGGAYDKRLVGVALKLLLRSACVAERVAVTSITGDEAGGITGNGAGGITGNEAGGNAGARAGGIAGTRSGGEVVRR